MSGPLDGVRVVELAIFIAGPSIGMLLADWGAEVIKIEAPEGDPWRYQTLGKPAPGLEAPVFELDNRGKRSVILDLKQQSDRERAVALIGSADVFLTNLRQQALERMRLDAASMRSRHPALIVLQVSGYGLQGPDAEKPGYDITAFWARSGYALTMGEPGQPPAIARGGMGDHTTAMVGAGAVCAALYRRSVTGQGDTVQVPLAAVGAYVQGVDHIGLLQGGRAPAAESREAPVNPLLNTYRTGDGRWIMLACLQGDRHWPNICRALDRMDLLSDERFLDNRARFRNNRALVRILDEAFGSRSSADWTPILDAHDIFWSVINDVPDAHADPQYAALGTFPTYSDPRTENPVRTVDSPVQFESAPRTIDRGAPRLGEHTDEVFGALGD